jgi:hypothetical protein
MRIVCCNGLPPSENSFEWKTSQCCSVVFCLFIFYTKFGSGGSETPLSSNDMQLVYRGFSCEESLLFTPHFNCIFYSQNSENLTMPSEIFTDDEFAKCLLTEKKKQFGG